MLEGSQVWELPKYSETLGSRKHGLLVPYQSAGYDGVILFNQCVTSNGFYPMFFLKINTRFVATPSEPLVIQHDNGHSSLFIHHSHILRIFSHQTWRCPIASRCYFWWDEIEHFSSLEHNVPEVKNTFQEFYFSMDWQHELIFHSLFCPKLSRFSINLIVVFCSRIICRPSI